MGFAARRRAATLLACGLIAAIFVPVPAGHAAPASIQISKTADSSAVNAGDQIGYTITVTNAANRGVNVVVNDALPTNAGTSWAISPAVSGCTISSGTLTCVARISGGSSTSVHIVSPTTTATCGTVSNQATATAPGAGSTSSQVAVITVNCAPTYSATLTDNGSCSLTLTGTWANTQVDHVYGQWYMDTFTGFDVFTTEAPGSGPNGGTLTGNTAVMTVGPLEVTPDAHTWKVLVQFYYQGAQVDQEWSNADTLNCGVQQSP